MPKSYTRYDVVQTLTLVMDGTNGQVVMFGENPTLMEYVIVVRLIQRLLIFALLLGHVYVPLKNC